MNAVMLMSILDVLVQYSNNAKAEYAKEGSSAFYEHNAVCPKIWLYSSITADISSDGLILKN